MLVDNEAEVQAGTKVCKRKKSECVNFGVTTMIRHVNALPKDVLIMIRRWWLRSNPGHNHESVSYTHLTLPTKRIV